MKLNEQNEVTCYACLDDNFNTIPAGTLLSGPADNLSNGQVPGAPEGTYCDFTVQWGDESWQVGYIGGTTDNTWDQIVNCGQPEEETPEPEEEETDVPERPRPPRPDGEKKKQWACKSGVSEFCVEITQDMLLPQGVTIADLQMNAFDSYETCVANKKGREGAINESIIKRLQKLAGIKK